MNNTKIEYADMTWNPVTGCNNSCEYCYARKIANRFGGIFSVPVNDNLDFEENGTLIVLDYPRSYKTKKGKIINAPYPYNFNQTFHRYRLGEPAQIKQPQTVFVGSMTDLFADIIPDEWIEEVFKACEAAPQHRYLFLTKNPIRYIKLAKTGLFTKNNNFWLGSTATDFEADIFYSYGTENTFISAEPLMGDISGRIDDGLFSRTDWVIIGAETGKRKNKVIPKREWIEKIIEECRTWDIPVFMKNSLANIWSEPLIQETPWEVRK